MSDRLGLRAITMQQPYAAALAHGVGLFSKRGKEVKFADGGEWVAVHCGQSDRHLRDAVLMKRVRAVWPECSSDAELRAGQKCILGVARFVDGSCVSTAPPASTDPMLRLYDCSKPVAWRAARARPCAPISYPKGQLQLWHLQTSGFGDKTSGKALLELARQPDDQGAKVKAEPRVKTKTAGSASSGARVKLETVTCKAEVKPGGKRKRG